MQRQLCECDAAPHVQTHARPSTAIHPVTHARLARTVGGKGPRESKFLGSLFLASLTEIGAAAKQGLSKFG
jgi:hypothetical protein